MTSHSTVASDSIPLWLLILLAVAWILPGLIGHEPWKPDEAYSFGLVYHILQTGDWVVPTLAGEPFMEKPPLFYITAALFAQALSPWLPLHDGAHLAAGFYIALTLLFTGLTAQELYGRGGAAAALALLACLGLAPLGHLLVTDLALLAGLALGGYGLALGLRHTPAGGICLGTGAGMAFLSKGLIGPGLIGLTALVLLFGSAWRTRSYFVVLGIAAAAVLPWLLAWPIALYLRSPDLFMTWLWDNNLGRFFGFSGLGPKQEAFFYLRTLPWFAWPAWLLALWTVWHERRGGFGRPGAMLPLATFASTFIVLTFAADARQVYALPLLLPLALLAAAAVDRLPKWATDTLYGLGAVATILVGILVWGAWSALEFGSPAALATYLGGAYAGAATGAGPIAITVAVLYSVGALAALYVLRRFRERPVAAWAVVTTLTLGLTMTLLLDWLDARKGYRHVIASLGEAMPESYRCVASDGLGEPQRAMLDYYLDVQTHRLSVFPVTNCDLLLLQEKAGELRQMDTQIWTLVWEGARHGDDKERFRLFRRD